MDAETRYKNDYDRKYGEKNAALRPGSNLGQDGDHDWRTDKNEAYKGHEASRVERQRGRGDNLRSEGDMDGESRYKNDYDRKYGERNAALRPGSNLGQDGDHDWRTDKNEAYRGHEASRVERQRGRGDNLRAEGDMDAETRYKNDYDRKYGEKNAAIRPGSNLGQDGDHDWRTDNKEAYRGHEASHVERQRGRGDNLRSEGDMEGKTGYTND